MELLFALFVIFISVHAFREELRKRREYFEMKGCNTRHRSSNKKYRDSSGSCYKKRDYDDWWWNDDAL